jgi:ribulose-phosphate 3-epimerase
MTTPILLSASILSADFSCLRSQIEALEQGGMDWIHIDVMDGHFVPNITMGPFIVETIRRMTKLPLDVHLMISQPELHIDHFVDAGANRISIHIEENPNVFRTLEHIRAKGCNPGIVLNPGTPSHIINDVIPIVDLVLVMTVNPGYSGQAFIPLMMPKVTQVRHMLAEQKSKALLQVDGGISTTTLPLAQKEGATVFVSATAIFKNSTGIVEGIRALRDSAF